jgi:sulfonate transport system substrate-binding protein
MFNRRIILSMLLGAAVVSVAAGTPPVAAADAPKEFRVGYQKGAAILVVAKQREVFEKRLKALGVDNVKWVLFQFGPPLLEALGTGNIDIGLVGDTPPIFAQAANANLVYVARSPAAVSGVVVPKDSPIQSLAELKGKKVALAKGSSSHNLTIRALKKAGLSFTDIDPVYLPPADAVAAFTTGKVDAWTLWDPYLAIAENKHNARVLATTRDKGLESNDFYLANRTFAETYPVVLKATIEEIGEVSKWAAENRDQLAKISSEVTGVDLDSYTIAFKRYPIGLHPITDDVIAQQQAIADSFTELKLIPAKIDVSKNVWIWPTN